MQQSKQLHSSASQTRVEASTPLDAQQLSVRHVDYLRHEIFHKTKAQGKGLSQGGRVCLRQTRTKGKYSWAILAL